MRMTAEQTRELFARGRVARLATVDAAGGPHVVPLVFALEGDVIFSAVDAKPKRSTALRRLANVHSDPRVCVLVDEYVDADWTRLWWARADGRARVLAAGEADAQRAIELLAARYAQYRGTPPAGEVLAIEVERWSGWRAEG